MDETKLGMLILLVVGLVLLKALAGINTAPKPVSKPFLTKRETAMLVALERALPHCRIHAQVAMGALLKAPTNPLRKARHSDRNAFSQKIVDFVAQDRATGAILALIEVDDYSHNAARDRARDAMTAHAGYRTVRIGRSVQPRFEEVHQAVSSLLMPPFSADRKGGHNGNR
jgi:very-short-patch-repair endonuclease